MRALIAIAFLLTTASCAVQTPESAKWDPCSKAVDDLRPRVAELQKTLPDGVHLQFFCYDDKQHSADRPNKHISLTAKEVRTLNLLRGAADAAYKAQSDYEAALIRKYVPNAPNLEDKCYRFVGIVSGDNFITDNPNVYAPWLCKEPK